MSFTDVKDPTQNVLKLVEMAVSRMDDIREVEARAAKELRELEMKRHDDLAAAEKVRVDDHLKLRAEQMEMRAGYTAQLTEAEAKRIDAIRVVDVNAVSVANERATAQAAVLANQVQASAEASRSLVATTATTIAQQLAQLTTQLTDRISLLEKSQYEGMGKQTLSDPMIAQLVAEMKIMRESNSLTKGSSKGMRELYGWIVGSVIAILSVITFLASHIKLQ